jgi:hypothetical protein
MRVVVKGRTVCVSAKPADGLKTYVSSYTGTMLAAYYRPEGRGLPFVTVRKRRIKPRMAG